MPPSYIKLETFCGRQCRIYNSELDGVNCLIHVFLQTHNLQRIIFRIFSQSRKMISNNVKKQKNKKKTCFNGVMQLSSHLPQTGIRSFWISNLLSLSSQGAVEGPFYINPFHDLTVAYVSWMLPLYLQLAVGFHDSSSSYHQ